MENYPKRLSDEVNPDDEDLSDQTLEAQGLTSNDGEMLADKDGEAYPVAPNMGTEKENSMEDIATLLSEGKITNEEAERRANGVMNPVEGTSPMVEQRAPLMETKPQEGDTTASETA